VPVAAERRDAVRHCLAVAVATLTADATTKLVAVALLDGRTVPVGGALWLTTVYNDTFARGMDVAGWAGLGAALLAVAVLALVWRACAPLARVDRSAPVALGLVVGAAFGNALDFAHTGRGAVDFLSVPTVEGALVFNVADVAAYLGLVLLGRTVLLLVAAIRRERAEEAPAAVAVRRRRLDVPVEVSVAVPLFVEADARAPLAVSVTARARRRVADHVVGDALDTGYASPRRMHDTTRSANRSTSSSVV
jgi:lipoprotein signal peptidase